MRTSSRNGRAAPLLAILALLDACSSEPTPRNATELGPDEQTLSCDLGSRIGQRCSRSRVEHDGANLWVVRHPDGAFRVFEQLPGGAGLALLAGADEARQTFADGVLTVAVGADRYYFPAEALDAE